MGARRRIGAWHTTRAVAGALVLLFHPAAQAQTVSRAPAASATKVSVRDQLRGAEAKLTAHDYTGALDQARGAYAAAPSPSAERILGQAEDGLGHPVEAAGWFDKFLAHVPDDQKAIAFDVEKRAAEIKNLPGKVHVDVVPARAVAAIDGRPAAPQPLDVELSPGTHTLRLAADGFVPIEVPLEVTFAGRERVRYELEVLPPPPPVPPPPPPPATTVVAATPVAEEERPPDRHALLVGAIVSGGVAVAGAAVGAAYGIAALNAQSSYNKGPTQELLDSAHTDAVLSDIGIGVAVAAAATSAVLLYKALTHASESAGTARPAPSPAIRATPVVAGHAAGGALSVRF